MKAAVYKALRTIEFQERPIPSAGAGQAVVKIKYCGICGTDMHIFFKGDPMVQPGIVLGHENVGTVFEVGPGVTGFKAGDRVVAGPPGSCGQCFYCLHGRPNICLNGFSQTNGLRLDGGMAEYMLVRDAARMLFKIPDNVSFEDAVLTDTIATAFRGISQSAFKPGDNVVVSGAGAIGLSVVRILKMAGAGHIAVLDIVEARRRMALKSGAELAFDPAVEPDQLAAKITAHYAPAGAPAGAPEGPDLVVEAAGVPQSLELCLSLPRAGGQLLNLGVSGEPARIVQANMVLKELNIKSSLAYSAEEVGKVLYFISSGQLSTAGLFSGAVPLSDLVEGGFCRLEEDKTLIKLAVAPG